MNELLLSSGKFFGQTFRNRTFRGISLTSLIYPGMEKHEKHSHEQALFCLSLKGAYSEQHGTRNITYPPGSIVFHPADEEHATEVNEGGSQVFVIEIGPEWIQRLEEYSCTPSTVIDLNHSEMSWYAKRMFYAFNEPGIDNDMQIEGLVLELLSCLVKENWKKFEVPFWLPKVLELLRSDFHQSLTIKYIAKEIGINPIQLSRTFRKCMRLSIAEYKSRLRVEFASEQLRCTSKDLRDVAMKAGFADQSHLTRLFKRFVGTTPAAYRQSFRKRDHT
jgi:AraC family transcriptional regulator